MARTFYTERDIEDLAKRGVKEIEGGDDVYITDLARERMEQLGVREVKPASRSSAPAPATAPAPASTLTDSERQQVIDRVKSGVIARLGPGVDAALVDSIVRRVVGQL